MGILLSFPGRSLTTKTTTSLHMAPELSACKGVGQFRHAMKMWDLGERTTAYFEAFEEKSPEELLLSSSVESTVFK